MKKFKDIIVIGFALFSMFFGAGNLVFPPYLGVISGNRWFLGFVGFIFADVGLALISIISAVRYNGSIDKITTKAGKNFGILLSITIITCLGPLLAIPRTAATTFEVGILPLAPNFNPVIFSVIFFMITLLLTIKPSKVIDIIGQVLTPLLLLALAVLIIKGITSPIGAIAESSKINNVLATGVSQGYQTMDALASIAFAFVVISSVISKGYRDYNQKVYVTIMSGLVAALGLALVYGGLAYVGATTSKIYGIDVPQTTLIVNITNTLLGFGGKIILGVIVALACLTTAIGLVSAAANYYEKLLNHKLNYSAIVIGICVFSAVISNFGVSTIILFSAPILTIIYPVTMALVFTTLLDKYIYNPNTYKGAVYTTLLVSLITIAGSYEVTLPYFSYLPLTNLGFNWVIPAIIGGIAGSFIKTKNPHNIFKKK